MKKIFCLLCILSLYVAGITAQTLPVVNVENAKGEAVSTQSLITGKPFILSFWGVTCKPCITELNTLNEVLE